MVIVLLYRERFLMNTKKIRDEFIALGVEPHILNLVTMLTALKFPTSGSCEGHFDKNLCPWVLFCVDQRKNNKEKCDYEKWSRKTSSLIRKLEMLLKEFHSGRSVPLDQKLEVQYEDKTKVTPFAFFKLQNSGTEVVSLIPLEIVSLKAKKIIVARYQKEMEDFATFLSTKLK